MTAPDNSRLVAVETSIYRLAHEAEKTAEWRVEVDKALDVLEAHEKAAVKCRDDLRGSILDLKHLIIEDKAAKAAAQAALVAEKSAAIEEKEALSSALSGKIRTATIAKTVGGLLGAALIALLGALVSPETAAKIQRALELIQ